MAVVSARKKKRKGTKPIPDWKPLLNFYQEKMILRFQDQEELDAAIDLLWTDAFRTLPHATPDGQSIIVPAEAVAHLKKAGLKFTAKKLLSIGDLSAEEIEKLRR